MTPTLDDRLAAGAAGLRRTVGAVPPPAPPRPGSPVPRALAALVLVCALAAGAVAVSRGGDDDGSDVAMSSGELPALVATDPPAGLGFSLAFDQELTDDAIVDFDGLAYDRVVYGDGDADDPFAERDLEVLSRTVPSGGEMTGDEEGATEAPVTVRGHEGIGGVYGDASTEAGLRYLQWQESDTLMLRVASYSLSEDELAAVAEALVVEDGIARLDAVPAGVAGPLDEVGRRHRADYVRPGDVREHTAYYTPDGGESTGEPGEASAMTTVMPGGEAELAALRWELGPGEAVEVDGEAGWLATDRLSPDPTGGDDAAVVITLVWPRSDGVLVRVDAAHLSRDDVLALAGSLEVVSPDEWAALVAQNGVTAVDDVPADESGAPVEEPLAEGVTLDDDERVPPPDAEVAQTGLAGNRPFGVWRDPGGATCAVWLDDRESLRCVGEPSAAAEAPWTTLGGEDGSLVFGVLPAGAVEVEVAPAGVTAVVGQGLAGTGVWALDTTAGLPATVTFRDAQGGAVGMSVSLAGTAVPG